MKALLKKSLLKLGVNVVNSTKKEQIIAKRQPEVATKKEAKSAIRKRGDIFFSDKDVEEKISSWLKSEKGDQTLKNFLKVFGITFPAYISSVDERTFSCTAGDLRDYTIQLRYGNEDSLPAVKITSANIESTYDVIDVETPTVELRKRVVKFDERRISTSWYDSAFSSKVTTDEYQVKVHIQIPDSDDYDLRRGKLFFIEADMIKRDEHILEEVFDYVKTKVPDVVLKEGILMVEYKRMISAGKIAISTMQLNRGVLQYA